MSLNNEQNGCENSEDKMLVCKKTVGIWDGKFSDVNSACLKALVHVRV